MGNECRTAKRETRGKRRISTLCADSTGVVFFVAPHPFVFDEKKEQLSDEKQRTWKILKRDGVVLEKYYVDVVDDHGKVHLVDYVHL